MSRYIGPILYSLFLWLVITAACWPVFCAVSLAAGHLTGEGWMLNSLRFEPKENMVAHFLEGYLKSLPFAALVGIVAVADYWLLARMRIFWVLSGILIPVSLAVVAFAIYKDPMPLLPTFLLSGFVLLIVYRILRFFRRNYA